METAVGRQVSGSCGLGFAATGIPFGPIIASLSIGCFATGLGGMCAFWLCCIFTRSLGASFGDYLARAGNLPHRTRTAR